MSEAQPKEARRPDPVVRRPSCGMPGTVIGAIPGRKYVIANPTDEMRGLRAYLDSGYHRINHKSDRERLFGGATQPNGDVTWMGQVLIWIEIEKYREMRAEADGYRESLRASRRAPGGIDKVVDSLGNLASNMVAKDLAE